MYFFDSDVCIEIMRGHLPRAQEIMRKSSPDLFGVPAIVEAELLYGAENSNNPEEGRYFVESLLSPLHIIPFDSTPRNLPSLITTFPGNFAGGIATGTMSPTCTFCAPVTIWRFVSSPQST